MPKRLPVAMTYATQENGDGSLRFNKEADALLKEGHTLVKQSGDARGLFTIEVRMVRKKMTPAQAKAAGYADDHPAIRKEKPMKNR